MSAAPYLKNGWAKKDGEGVYWLFIQGGDLKAMFRLTLEDDMNNRCGISRSGHTACGKFRSVVSTAPQT